MSHEKEIHVNISEVKIGTGTDILQASLGSCVGIVFLWKKRKLYGLAHCLLPEHPSSEARGLNARYVSQAIPALISLMEIGPKDHREIDAVITGGGNMTAPKDANPSSLVGIQNALAAEKYLQQFRIVAIHKDLGGESGRKIRIFCETGEFSICTIPRISSAVS